MKKKLKEKKFLLIQIQDDKLPRKKGIIKTVKNKEVSDKINKKKEEL